MRLILFTLFWIFSFSACNKKESPNFKRGNVYGIDVSHHQGEIEWGRVAENTSPRISFVYIKVTEGATFQDPKYLMNI